MEPSDAEHEKERIDRLRRAMYSRELSGKIKDKPRRQFDDVRPVVGEDWRREEDGLPGAVVAPSAIRFVRSALWWALGLAALFFIGSVLFFAYYFTLGSGASPASAANIDISISGPPQVSGGEPTQLHIVVTNRNQVPLQLTELVITYPPGTRSPTDLSTDLSSQRISLGTIESGGRRQGVVSAVFAGSEDTTNVTAELEYRIAGSSAIFFASSGYQAITSTSPLTLSVEGNTEITSGQGVEFTVTLASNASATVKDVLLAVDYPFGFTQDSAVPAESRPGVWEIGDIAPGQRRQVTIRGTLLGESGDERVFRFDSGTRKSKDETTIQTSLAYDTLRVKVSEPFLDLALSVNKSTGKNVVVQPGGNVSVAIEWENNLPIPVQDAVIIARLSGIAIDGATVVSSDGFYRSTDGVILWDKTTTNGVLENLAAGARGTVSFTFRMPASEEIENIANPTLTFTVSAAGKRAAESGVPQSLQSIASQRIVVSSDLLIAAQGLYYANPFSSTGPLPPKAEKETTYGIIFTITNTTSRITDARITATLPSYVRWLGIYSPNSEDMYFRGTGGEPESSECRNFTEDYCWSIGTVEAGVGTGGSTPRQAAIGIGFTPSTSQIGQEPPLLRDITFTGVDEATGVPVTKRLDDVTTDLVRVSKSGSGIPTAVDPGFSSSQGTVVR